jgi:hypothetical protein
MVKLLRRKTMNVTANQRRTVLRLAEQVYLEAVPGTEEGNGADRSCTWFGLGADVDQDLEPFDVARFGNAVVIDLKDQLATATKFFEAEYGDQSLVHHQGKWNCWNGNRYETVLGSDIKARLWKWLATRWCWKKTGRVRCQPTRNDVTGVMDALKAVCNQSSSMELPCWLEGAARHRGERRRGH